MKIRTDYVSNSSSSSFIIGNSQFMENFKIGKKKLIDTLKALLPEKEHNGFRVYDMRQARDVKALEKIEGCLDGFSCTLSYIDRKHGDCLTAGDTGYETWGKFKESFVELYDIRNWNDWNKDEDYYQYIWKYDNDGKCTDTKKVKPPKWMIETIKKFRHDSGVITNWEAAHRPETRFVIHFDDNVIWELKGVNEYGRKDNFETPYFDRKTLTKDQKEKNKQIRNSKWETESYTFDRICEILMTYWIENGIIDPNDEVFVEEFGDDGYAGYPNRYPALYAETIAFCGHEG